MTNFNLESVLRKTVAGLDAIKLRDRALTPKMRMLLIMVDGVKTGTELLNSIPNADDERQLLAELVSGGYVEQIHTAKPDAAPPAVAMPKPVGSAANDTLKASIRRSTRLLEDILGPDSVSLCVQLERCTNQAQFNAKVTEVARIIAVSRSERRAAEFLSAATA